MQSAHTKGDWFVGKAKCGNEHVMVETSPNEYRRIATVDADNGKANGQLIAASPDLLAALEALLARDERNTCEHEETHRGSNWTICDQCGQQWADDRGGMPQRTEPAEWISARAAIAKARGTL